jgi:hypothetical protein
LLISKEFDYQREQARSLSKRLSVAELVQVEAFDARRMTVDLKPLSKRLNGSGEYQSGAPMLCVPVVCVKCGPYRLRPWFERGDVGLVLYIDHDIDRAVESGRETEPNTERNHSPSDAVFLGGICAGAQDEAGFPDEAWVIGLPDGAAYVAIGKEGVQIKGDVQVDGNVTVSGSITGGGEAY